MAILLFAENTEGKIKKAVLEAASYGKALADAKGVELHAVSVGKAGESELQELGKYGVSKVYRIDTPDFEQFDERAYPRAIEAVAKSTGASAVVLAQSYNGKVVAPRLAVRLDAAYVSGATEVPSVEGDNLVVRRLTNSGKGIETVRTERPVAVIAVKANSFGVKENAGDVSIEDFAHGKDADKQGAVSGELVKKASGVSITEAAIVVSGGRGFKGPENWTPLLEMAELLGAGTACSKPVADMDWRPHHEHVGQTGIQIAPNLYIAIGISGAIQHLAGVNSSKNIVVINKDPEAPFFKIADYGIVGDLFEVLPKLNDAIRAVKASN